MTRAHVLTLASIATLAIGTATPERLVPVEQILDIGPEASTGVAEPASGRFLVYTGDHAIKVYTRQTRKTFTIPVAVMQAFGGSLSISRSGRRLVFPADDASGRLTHIWSVDLDTITGAPAGEPHRVSVVPARMASISPDGRWIALSANDNGTRNWGAGTRLVVIPSDGGDERMLDSGVRIMTPRWSSDNKTLFYIRGRGKGPALTRIAVSGGVADSIAPATAVIGVSPDGKHVAFSSSFRASRETVRLAETSGKLVGEFDINADEEGPRAWSPDGRTLLGLRFREPATLKTVSLTDEHVSNYIVSEKYPRSPRFSRDGSRLGMVGKDGDRDQFVIFDLKTKQRRVVPTDRQPEPATWQWSPDGSRIAYLTIDAVTNRHQLHTLDLASARSTHLADFGFGFQGDAVLFRWRSDGRAIDYIDSASPDGSQAIELHRVTLAGVSSLIRTLPLARHGSGTDGGYRLINDSLVLIGADGPSAAKPQLGPTGLQAVPIPAGEPSIVVASHAAYWMMAYAQNIVSPDGKWVAFGSVGTLAGKKAPQWAVASLDGTTFRLLGTPMACDVWPQQWLPDSRAYIAVGAGSCQDWREDEYIVPIDGSPARRIQLPDNQGRTLTPDGKSLLVAANDPRIGSIVRFDVTGVMGTVTSAGKAKKPGGR